MLGSITPLGERGRGSRWWLTTTAYVVGSVVGGVAMGALMGAIGAAVFPSIGLTGRLVVLAVAVGAGLLVDLGIVRRRAADGAPAGRRSLAHAATAAGSGASGSACSSGRASSRS